MTRRPDDAPKRAPVDIGFEPTTAQLKAKAAFWRRYREDPSFEPSATTMSQARAMVGVAEFEKWWGQAGFREWFLHTDAWRDTAHAAFEQWTTSALRKLAGGGLSDKDFITLGKLLAELTNNIPRVGAADKDAAKRPQLSDKEAMRQLYPLLVAKGWRPPDTIDAEATDVSQ